MLTNTKRIKELQKQLIKLKTKEQRILAEIGELVREDFDTIANAKANDTLITEYMNKYLYLLDEHRVKRLLYVAMEKYEVLNSQKIKG